MAEQDGKIICPHCGAENVASPLITMCSSCFGALDQPAPEAPQPGQSSAPEQQYAVWTPPEPPPLPKAPPPPAPLSRPDTPSGPLQPPPAPPAPPPNPFVPERETPARRREVGASKSAYGPIKAIIVLLLLAHWLPRLFTSPSHAPPPPPVSRPMPPPKPAPSPPIAEPLPALHSAARSGNLQGIKRLLDQGVRVDQRDSLGRTPLHLAAWNDQLAVAKLLIERGANVDARTNAGDTPLKYATARNNPDIAALLREHGAKR